MVLRGDNPNAADSKPDDGAVRNGKTYCKCIRYCEGGRFGSRATWFNHRNLPKAHTPSVGSESLAEFVANAQQFCSNSAATRGVTNTLPPRPRRRGRRARKSHHDVQPADPLPENENDAIDENMEDPRMQSMSPSRREHTPPGQPSLSRSPSRSPSRSRPPSPTTQTSAGTSRGAQSEQDTLNSQHENTGGHTDAPGTSLPAESDEPPIEVYISDMANAVKFIKLLKDTRRLEDTELDEEVIKQIREPAEEELSIDNPDVLLSLELFLAVGNASLETYDAVRAAIQRHSPNIDVLSYYRVKRAVEKLTGVCPVKHDMCVKSCVAFTGPYSSLDKCPKCGQPRYQPTKSQDDARVGRQQCTTIMLGPQLQALRRTADGQQDLKYLYDECVRILTSTPPNTPLPSYTDLASGSLILEAVADGRIKKDDFVLMFSIDGAQLYRNKQSDCWIYLWLIVNLSPDKRYKKVHVLPGAVIPGPDHPKDLDSFLFPGFHHLAALMQEGLPVFDFSQDTLVSSFPFLAAGLADGPAMALMEGTVGHHGAHGCRCYCGLPGRHKPGCPHYYPVLLKPENYNVDGSNHDDISLASIQDPSVADYEANLQLLLAAENENQYNEARKATGLCKPSIFSGLSRTFPVPLGFPLDLMHLADLNLGQLMLELWRGTIKGSRSDPKKWGCAVLQDTPQEKTWTLHGSQVERAKAFLPGFFDRAPRNIADKISSGYKAVEWHTYLYNYTPSMLRNTLPPDEWQHLCKLVKGVRLMYQETIPRDDIVKSHRLLTQATLDFENIYYKRDPDRLHVVRPAIHTIWHGPGEILRRGSLICCTQLTMERLIGDLGSEIKQPSNPYANLSQRAVRRCQVNALKAMMPQLDRARARDPHTLPREAYDLHDGYALLRALATRRDWLPEGEAKAFYDYLSRKRPDEVSNTPRETFCIKIRKWARARLPTQQVARSAWKEREKPLAKLRMARCVKIEIDGRMEVAEVQYFCQVGAARHAVALISVFGSRDETLYQGSCETIERHEYRGSDTFRVVDVKSIKLVIGMIPDWIPEEEENGAGTDYEHLVVGKYYIVVEKLGLQLGALPQSDDPEMHVDG